MSFWSWARLRRNFTGLSLARRESSSTGGVEAGVGVGLAEGDDPLSADCPHAVAHTKNISNRASLLFPIRVNSILWLERPDHAYGHGGAGKQGDRLAQILKDTSAGAL